jgi:hypothetical protein
MKQSAPNFLLNYVPDVSVTGTGTTNDDMQIDHRQLNWQLVVSSRSDAFQAERKAAGIQPTAFSGQRFVSGGKRLVRVLHGSARRP